MVCFYKGAGHHGIDILGQVAIGAGFDAVQLSSDTHNAPAGLKALGRDPRLYGISQR